MVSQEPLTIWEMIPIVQWLEFLTGGTKQVSTDAGLIKYGVIGMYSFEMCEIKYHIKLPIFIARQWIRHRTANVNGILQDIQF